MTIVPGVAAGGGVGESVRNNGWMCASLLTLSVGLWVRVGFERSRELFAGL